MLELAFPLPFVNAVRAPVSSSVPPARIDARERDGELVRRVRRGDRWAEEALYHRHVRTVTRVVMRLLARSAEAEDVVQDTFILALRDLGKLRDPDAFGEWLLSIAVRQVYRRFRKWKLLRAFGLDAGRDDTTLAQQADPSASPETRAALSEVARLLATLSSEERVAWVLRRVEGEKLDAVAVACGCSRATAKRRIARADSVIRASVSLSGAEEDDD